MKPFLYLACSALLLTPLAAQDTPSNSNPPPPPPEGAGAGTHHPHPDFIAKLNLTDAQKAQIAQIKQSTPDRKAQREQIMAVLTLDQKAQLKQLHDQWKAQHPKPGTTTPGAPSGAPGSAVGPETSPQTPPAYPPPAPAPSGQ